MNSEDKEYWNYLHTYGSEEEKEKGSDYFDVSISAFNETYESFFNEYER